MKLYLVQHAEAKSKEEDPERPLSEKGWADIQKVAAYVAACDLVQPARIIHSGKTRAQQTAKVLADVLHPTKGLDESPDLSAMADPSLWADRLKNTEGDTILVGHLPHLSKLAARLVCQDEEKKVINFQNSGIVCLDREDREGKEAWSVHWILTPEIIK